MSKLNRQDHNLQTMLDKLRVLLLDPDLAKSRESFKRSNDKDKGYRKDY